MGRGAAGVIGTLGRRFVVASSERQREIVEWNGKSLPFGLKSESANNSEKHDIALGYLPG